MGRIAVAAIQTMLAVLVIGVAPSLAASPGPHGAAGAGFSSRSWAGAAPTTGATYHTLTPARILDTRDGTGGPSGKLSVYVARTFQVTGNGGVPDDASAVTGNLTVTQQSAAGYLFIGPIAMNNPTSSTLNFPANDNRANAVTVALGTGSALGTLSITYVSGIPSATTHVVFDVTGYFTPDTSGATYHALAPARILDSRDGTGGLSGKFSAYVARTFQVTGSGGVPVGAVAVTGNLTVTQQSAAGYLFIGPVATNNPTSSTLNFPVGDNRANAVTVALGTGSALGTLSITYVAGPAGATTHVVFDVSGYFTADATGTTYVALTPTRILDSRDGTGGLAGKFSSYVARTFRMTVPTVPADASAVTGNLTVTQQSSAGYLFMGPIAMNNPTSSTLNFPVGDNRANAVTTALGAGGTLSITYVAPTGGATTHVVFDVTGYFTPDPNAPPIWTLDISDPRADRWQDPDLTACTAAATLSMLNDIYYTGTATGLVWQPTISYTEQETILAYERANMTMLTTSNGTDPHGWRNALNYYGWGSLTAAVYRDSSYTSFDTAAKAAVSALARFHKPVGILAHAGRHSQYVVGYMVAGDDPGTGSTNFTIVGVDLTDPLQSAGLRDTWVYLADWRSGGASVQFSPYLETDSPYQDPIDGQVGTTEWYGKWVVIDPLR